MSLRLSPAAWILTKDLGPVRAVGQVVRAFPGPSLPPGRLMTMGLSYLGNIAKNRGGIRLGWHNNGLHAQDEAKKYAN